MKFTVRELLEILWWCLVGVLIVVFLVVRKHIFLNPAGTTDLLSSIAGVWIIGLLLLAFASFLVCSNLYAGFFAPRNHRRKNGSMDDFKFVSGIPIVGSVLVLLSALLFPANRFLGVLFLILIVLDIVSILIGRKYLGPT